jgi:hypothetical protein
MKPGNNELGELRLVIESADELHVIGHALEYHGTMVPGRAGDILCAIGSGFLQAEEFDEYPLGVDPQTARDILGSLALARESHPIKDIRQQAGNLEDSFWFV